MIRALFCQEWQKASETVRNNAKRKNEQRGTDRGRSTPQLRNDNGCIGAHADYRRDDYIFPRTQSLTMRLLDWEDRLKPIRPWGSNLVANLAWEIFA
jgi:hypothetical protein